MSCSVRMARCPVGCRHRQFVMDYRQERQRREQTAVESSNGYATELADYLDQEPLPTFKGWLVASRRPVGDREMSVAAVSSGAEWSGNCDRR
jgi:hypothetical protein